MHKPTVWQFIAQESTLKDVSLSSDESNNSDISGNLVFVPNQTYGFFWSKDPMLTLEAQLNQSKQACGQAYEAHKPFSHKSNLAQVTCFVLTWL